MRRTKCMCSKIESCDQQIKYDISSQKSLRTECKKCRGEKWKTTKRLRLKNTKPDSLKYKCPCCNKTEKELRKHGRWKDRPVWALDHNHLTNEFRGWICNNCNVGIGFFYEDINIIKNVFMYLNEGGNWSETH